MDPEIVRILSHDQIEWPRKLHSEYDFRFSDIPLLIRIRLYEIPNSEQLQFTQSHFIQTPLQASPYRTDAVFGDNEFDCLRLALRTLTDFYEEAVRLGNTPEIGWFVPNDDF